MERRKGGVGRMKKCRMGQMVGCSEMYRGEGRLMGAERERVGKWEGGSEEGKRGRGQGMRGWW